MNRRGDFGPETMMEISRVSDTGVVRTSDSIAAEIPLTIVANGTELATLLASPSDLRELTTGYLFTSGYITTPDEITEYCCDRQRWTVTVTLSRMPDPSLMRKRLYTTGCGRCAMYTTVAEISMREKLRNNLTIPRRTVFNLASRIQEGTVLFRRTGSVHCSLLIDTDGGREFLSDDVARHNSLDKVIGAALTEGTDFSRCIVARTGRTSSEIIHKLRRCGIPLTISRGAPTHQAVHLARDMGITLIGFARPDGFNIYAGEERVAV